MKFLIWSNEHQMWWRWAERGYTQYVEEAGRYTRSDAEDLVSRATLAGRLAVSAVDPVTERPYARMSEVLMLAPECIPHDEKGMR